MISPDYKLYEKLLKCELNTIIINNVRSININIAAFYGRLRPIAIFTPEGAVT
jgi:hypothetical protein